MKCAYLGCVIQFLTTTFLLSQQNPVPAINQTARVASLSSASQADPNAQARILDSYGKLPLSFEVNHGQTDVRVKFLSRTSGYTLFLTGDEAGRRRARIRRRSRVSLTTYIPFRLRPKPVVCCG